ncbi:hypothetical protein BC835DRAFT_1309029 [Cytidiella melzeri]|nr:hypothetical protein BC835DRAFT_1309029 [Cytidiella melzeri]
MPQGKTGPWWTAHMLRVATLQSASADSEDERPQRGGMYPNHTRENDPPPDQTKVYATGSREWRDAARMGTIWRTGHAVDFDNSDMFAAIPKKGLGFGSKHEGQPKPEARPMDESDMRGVDELRSGQLWPKAVRTWSLMLTGHKSDPMGCGYTMVMITEKKERPQEVQLWKPARDEYVRCSSTTTINRRAALLLGHATTTGVMGQ